jgi:hypothetical protein
MTPRPTSHAELIGELNEKQRREAIRDTPIKRALATYNEKVITPLLAELHQRIAELETRSLSYGGTWKDGRAYGVNTIVTDQGTVWCSTRATAHRPGSSEDWKLMVKSPRR